MSLGFAKASVMQKERTLYLCPSLKDGGGTLA